MPYYKKQYRPSVPPSPWGHGTATDAQVNFLLSLYDDLSGAIPDPDDEGFSGTPEQAQSLRTLLDRVVEFLNTTKSEGIPLVQVLERTEAMRDARLEIGRGDREDDATAEVARNAISKTAISIAIGMLKDYLPSAKSAVNRIGLKSEKNSEYPGVPADADRVIQSRFASRCSGCGIRDQFIAYQRNGAWHALCRDCATVNKSVIPGLIQQVWDRLGVGANKQGTVGLALPSDSALGGVDYIKVSRDGVIRIKGGDHALGGSRLSAKEAEVVLTEVLKHDVADLAKAWGREFKTCGVCARALKDPISKEIGIGPDCLARLS